MTELERMTAGLPYMSNSPELREAMRSARSLTDQINATTIDQMEYRTQLFRRLLGSTGEKFYIESPFRCDYGFNIHIGENFYANYDCIILDVCRVDIGRDVMFGPRVGIYAAGHPTDPQIRASGLEWGGPVTVGDRVWVGGSAVLNPGVSIGADTIIASGAVVTGDIPAGVVAGGVPCRVIREIGEEDTRHWQAQRAAYEQARHPQ